MSRSETVWIVDDDRSIRWVLEKALQQEGMATQSFDSADSVLARLARQQPDVIISDIRMPGLSGLDMLSQIREQYPRLPVIIMTAHSDLDSAVASYQGGAFEYLPKPFDVDDAVSLVKRANQHAQEQLNQQQHLPLLKNRQHQKQARKNVHNVPVRMYLQCLHNIKLPNLKKPSNLLIKIRMVFFRKTIFVLHLIHWAVSVPILN